MALLYAQCAFVFFFGSGTEWAENVNSVCAPNIFKKNFILKFSKSLKINNNENGAYLSIFHYITQTHDGRVSGQPHAEAAVLRADLARTAAVLVAVLDHAA